ncbi:MAG: hypothetical protein JSV88_21755 [Candidatus Aminicenantes bacterium]|nr:MAG: hypothetical protein JSV88_21755 [Candidatus Aminicenantes bacterium]
MKKVLLLLTAIITAVVFSIVGYSQEQPGHKPIVESVEVNWWQAPIFAVDKDGNPIIDLKKTDIEVWLNNRRIETFTFYKRAFIASQQTGSGPGQPPEVQKKETQPLPVLKNNTIFLLFDVAMSAITCTKRSKEIAQKIVTSSEPGAQFVVLSIEPFKGLNYIYGPSANKEETLRKIDKKVKGKPNDRNLGHEKFFGASRQGTSRQGGTGRQQGAGNQGWFSSRNSRGKILLNELAATFYLRKARSFFNSFKTLYLMFNSIEDNKFVYFFTEGLSKSMRGKLMGGSSLYKFHLKKIAKYLGKSGAVLFIVNPMGVHDDTTLITQHRDANSSAANSPTSYFDSEKSISGEDWLRYLAVESGGKYLEGKNEVIIKTLDHMQRAYYEISFPDLPGLKGRTRTITIKSKRNNVFIHSLRSLEKNKRYLEMSHIEKEIVAVNLITQTPLVKARLSCQQARIIQVEKNKKDIIYTVLLPENFLNQDLDLYKLWVKDDREVISIKTQSLVPEQEKIEIQFDKKGRKAPRCKPYFVLVNGKTETALVRVIGDELTDTEEP